MDENFTNFFYKKSEHFNNFSHLYNVLASYRVEKVTEKQGDECSLSDVDDVIMILRNDYENAYFVTGMLFYLYLSVKVLVSVKREKVKSKTNLIKILKAMPHR